MIVENRQELKKIFFVYSRFLEVRHDYQESDIIERTKESLRVIVKWPIFKESESFVWKSLAVS